MEKLSIKECRDYLGEINLTDEQLENLRDALYILIEQVLDEYINK